METDALVTIIKSLPDIAFAIVVVHYLMLQNQRVLEQYHVINTEIIALVRLCLSHEHTQSETDHQAAHQAEDVS
jgi:hypothetical protein